MHVRAAVVAGMALITGLAGPAARAADTYTADPVHSSVVFRIKHMNTSYSWGRFNTLAGKFTIDHADPSQCQLDFVVDTESVDTANAKRDEHLKSPDFFNAKQFPKITFKSTSIKVPASDDDPYEVTGNLTLHGVTKPVVAKVKATGFSKGMDGKPIAGIEGNFTLKRSDFGMTNMVGPVGDDVWVNVSIEGAQK
jgi:polyisoprenoid-binding protein YceI